MINATHSEDKWFVLYITFLYCLLNNINHEYLSKNALGNILY